MPNYNNRAIQVIDAWIAFYCLDLEVSCLMKLKIGCGSDNS